MLKIAFQPLLVSLLLLLPIVLQAQTDDHLIWASVKVQKKIDQKTTLAFEPIFRFNENISKYQNMSIDISAKRKFAKGWSVQVLARTWFIPDQKSRQFLWLDLGYGRSFKQWKAATGLRYHGALDINDREDPDFIRWKTTFSLLNMGKVIPFIAIEPWFRLNGFDAFHRMRYEPGLNYKMNSQWNLTFKLRREVSLNLEPEIKVNMYVITLAYALGEKKKRD